MSYAVCPSCGNVCDVPGVHFCPGEKPPVFVRIREPSGVEHYINLKAIKGVALTKVEGQARAFLDVTTASGRWDRLDLDRGEAERAFAIITAHGNLEKGAE